MPLEYDKVELMFHMETMTAIRLICEPATGNPNIPRLDLEWDAHAGTISGEGADWLRDLIAAGGVRCHPGPGKFHTFGSHPLRNRADLAALIGYAHRLPEELAGDYPSAPDKIIVVELLDDAGNVLGVDSAIY